MISHLKGWFALLVCYITGQVFALITQLPIPPALVGLGFLLLAMAVWRKGRQPLTVAASPLLAHMSILFVPATLGVVLYWEALAKHPIALLLATGVTTLIALALTAIISDRLIGAKSR